MRAVALLLAASLLVPAAAGSAITTVILVRHAEKASPDEDPPLSAGGASRAEELARVLAGAGIQAIYTTQFRRTIDTAAPLAARLGLQPRMATTGKTYAEDLAARILREHTGQTVLVVGHSNSTRDVLRRLGAGDPPPIEDGQYDDLFICTIAAGKTTVVALRYGAPAR